MQNKWLLHIKRKQYFHFLTFLIFGLFSINASSADKDNKGTEFIIPFLPNAYTGAQTTKQLHLTSETATSVTVTYPINSPTFTTVVDVIPGLVTVVDMPADSDVWTSNAIANNLVSAKSDDEFVAYIINRVFQSSDAALALPIDTMNSGYIVSSYPSVFASFNYYSQLLVYAAYDNSQVTITPRVAAQGHAAGVPFTVTLNVGEGYYLTGSVNGDAGDLTGTIIDSNRPVGLINGNQCTQVPNGTVACDHIFEVAQPLTSWGKSALVANLPLRPLGSIYRVIAGENNTTVYLDGLVLASGLSKGQFYETKPLTGNHEFSSNNPIFVTQFMVGQGGSATNTGDPAMGNMTPAEQYLNSYTFSTVGGAQFARHFLTLIASNADIGLVTLDGAPIVSSDFSPIPGTDFSSAVKEITEGTHFTYSPTPHGITVEGFNDYDSYIYPGGARFKTIATNGDNFDPVCTITGSNGNYIGKVIDSKPSEDTNNDGFLSAAEDTNGNGIIDVDKGVESITASLIENFSLVVNPFDPGEKNTSYTLTVIDPNISSTAKIVGTDTAGNTCDVTVNLDVVEPPEPVQCDFDSDQDVDNNDIMGIRQLRNTPAEPNDPLDIDNDGVITMNDVRKCIIQCTRSKCAAE